MKKLSELVRKLKTIVEKFFKGNIAFEEKIFYETRSLIVEKGLSPERAKIFRKLSFEDKKLFVNVLIAEGRLSW